MTSNSDMTTKRQFVNLTPHGVRVYGSDGSVIADIPASGAVARLSEQVSDAQCTDGIPEVQVTLGEVEGLPDPVQGTLYIVSLPLMMGLLAAGSTRQDVRYPYDPVRDGQGRIVGCRSLAEMAVTPR